MTPFQQATIPKEEKDALVQNILESYKKKTPEIHSLYQHCHSMVEVEYEIRRHVEVECSGLVFVNDTYQVLLRKKVMESAFGVKVQTFWLSIKRLDREPCRDWRHFQQIKNEIIGPEYEAMELYPADSRLVDGANQYHLWGIHDPDYRFPFGFNERMVSETPVGKSKQRKL